MKRTILVFCSIFLTTPCFSQFIFSGTVMDNGGDYLGSGAEPVQDLTVTIMAEDGNNTSMSATTDSQGSFSIILPATHVRTDAGTTPHGFRLLQNYPNPFNPSTVVGFIVNEPGPVTIDIYDIRGRKIRKLLDGFQQESGWIVWDATDDNAVPVAAGVYICCLNTADTRTAIKMVLSDGRHRSLSPAAALPLPPVPAGESNALTPQPDRYKMLITGTDIRPFTMENIVVSGNHHVAVTVERVVRDNDGTLYDVVKIGDQWWMAENLKVRRFRNGEVIPFITGYVDEWANLSTPGSCVYGDSEDTPESYGLLYNWYALADNRGITPPGWHVPSDLEFKELESFLGLTGTQLDSIGRRGSDQGMKLKSQTFWADDGNGTNETGFCALPCGYRVKEGYYGSETRACAFWTLTQIGENAWYRSLGGQSSQIYRNHTDKVYGFSVRLVRD
ncbi:T9SS type A sorting domain-containing protein [bacterium]|nr:T9SS type A sorting domain-containing protein [bacterium]